MNVRIISLITVLLVIAPVQAAQLSRLSRTFFRTTAPISNQAPVRVYKNGADGIIPVIVTAALCAGALLQEMKSRPTPLEIKEFHDTLERPERLLKAHQMLNRKKKLVDATDPEQNSALHAAARGHNAPAITMLVAAGAEVNAQNLHNQTPLHVGSLGCDGFVTAKQLIDLGANSYAKDDQERTHMDYCKRKIEKNGELKPLVCD